VARRRPGRALDWVLILIKLVFRDFFFGQWLDDKLLLRSRRRWR
jgi:hypothetical protein